MIIQEGNEQLKKCSRNFLPLSDWRDSGKLWSIESCRLSSSRSNSSVDTLDLADCLLTKTSGRNSLFGSSDSSSGATDDNIIDFDAVVNEVIWKNDDNYLIK